MCKAYHAYRRPHVFANYSPLQTLRGKCDSRFDSIQDGAQQGGKSGRLLLNLGEITWKTVTYEATELGHRTFKFHEIPNCSFSAIG